MADIFEYREEEHVHCKEEVDDEGGGNIMSRTSSLSNQAMDKESTSLVLQELRQQFDANTSSLVIENEGTCPVKIKFSEELFDGAITEEEEDEEWASMNPFLRFLKWANSDNFHEKQMLARTSHETLRYVAESETTEEVAAVLDIITTMSSSDDPILRTELMEQVPQIAFLAHDFPDRLGGVVTCNLVPMVVKYLTDNNDQVRKTCQAALLVLLEQELVSHTDVYEQVCPVILDLTEPDAVDDFKTEAVALMSKMAPLVGQEMTERLFMERFTRLCSDELFQVRKVCAANFGDLSGVVSTNAAESLLLPRFVCLCEDGVWGVRKACADVFMVVSCACSLETRREHLSPVFVSLLSDQSRWVRIAAFQNLGPFISTFADPKEEGSKETTPAPTSLDYSNSTELTSLEASTELSKLETATNEFTAKDIEDSIQSLSSTLLSTTHYESPTVIKSQEGNPSTLRHPCEKEGCSVGSRLEESDPSFNQLNYWRNPLPPLDLDVIANCEDPNLPNQESTSDEDPYSDTEATLEVASSLIEKVASSLIEKVASSLIEKVASSLIENVDDRRIEDEVSPDTKEDSEEPTSEDNRNAGERKMTYAEAVSSSSSSQYEESSGELFLVDEDWEDTVIFHSYDRRSNSNFLYKEPDSRIQMPDIFSICDNLSSFPDLTVLPHTTGFFGNCQPMIRCRDPHANFPPSLNVKQDIVPNTLLEHYISMTDPFQAESVDNEITRHCAYSLPAVALTLGRRYWPVLKDTYQTLAGDMHWKVRRTLAFSIHQLAYILGEDLALNDLLPVFEGFIKDLDEVRIGVLKNLSDFLRLLPPSRRTLFLPHLSEFLNPDNSNNWRFRLELALQLGPILELFSAEECWKYITPITFALLDDKVVHIRKTCFGVVSKLSEKLMTENEHLYILPFSNRIKEKFAQSPTWTKRQTFVFIVGRIVYDGSLPPPLVCSLFLGRFLELAQDKVPNIRLAVAKIINSSMLTREYFTILEYFTNCDLEGNSGIHEVLENLKNDMDRDVQYFAKLPAATTEQLFEEKRP